MPCQIDILKKRDYLLATISEREITVDNANYIFDVIGSACEDYDCHGALLDERSVNRRVVRTLDIYNLGRDMGLKGFTYVKLAILCQEELIDDDAVFLKTVAHNNSSTVDFFSNEDDAIKWLEEGNNS